MDEDSNVKCPKCNWKGKGENCIYNYNENYEMLIPFICPNCDTECVLDE